MTKARDLANAADVLDDVSATELGYVNGVTSAIQTQIDSKEPTLPSQTGNSGKYLTTDGTNKSWGTVSQYSLPSQTGNSGKFLTTNGTSESWGTVNQPITWTERRTANGDAFKTIAYNGTNLYVIVGANAKLATSPDGITWTDRTSGFSAGESINGVAYGNGLWVIVGETGKIFTSTNGTTWTARTANFGTNHLNDVAYGNGVWVAVGNGGGTTNTGGITYSTDGITWTRKSQSLTVGPDYYAVAWNGTNWIVGGDISTNNILYATTPSGTWTAGVAVASRAISSVFYDGTRTMYTTGQNELAYTTNTNGTGATAMGAVSVPLMGTGSNQSSYYENGKFYFAGAYISSVSTTPLNNYAQNYTSYGLSPAAAVMSTTGVATNSSTRVLFVTSSGGFIVAGENGRIWTSF